MIQADVAVFSSKPSSFELMLCESVERPPEGPQWCYAGRIRAGIPVQFRRAALPHFEQLRIPRCPFFNLPDRTEGRWGEGLTTARMALCRWLDPVLVARIEFLQWTPEQRLRHPRFAGIRSDKNARDVIRE
jgi:ATP-dependent DNA ligase